MWVWSMMMHVKWQDVGCGVNLEFGVCGQVIRGKGKQKICCVHTEEALSQRWKNTSYVCTPTSKSTRDLFEFARSLCSDQRFVVGVYKFLKWIQTGPRSNCFHCGCGVNTLRFVGGILDGEHIMEFTFYVITVKVWSEAWMETKAHTQTHERKIIANSRNHHIQKKLMKWLFTMLSSKIIEMTLRLKVKQWYERQRYVFFKFCKSSYTYASHILSHTFIQQPAGINVYQYILWS